MGNHIGKTVILQRLHNIPNHWFNHNNEFDNIGVHQENCDGINMNTQEYELVCSRENICSVCQTPIYYCTSSNSNYNSNSIQHDFCKL